MVIPNKHNAESSVRKATNGPNDKKILLIVRAIDGTFPRIGPKRPRKDDGFPLRSKKSLPLWKRILAWCQYAKWYNADSLQEDYYAEYTYVNEIRQTRTLLHDPYAGFAFPPVTEDTFLQVERRFLFVGARKFCVAEGHGYPFQLCCSAHRDPTRPGLVLDHTVCMAMTVVVITD